MAISREYKVKIKATIDPSEISKQIDALGKNSKLKFDTGGIDSANKKLQNTGKNMKTLGSLADSVFGKFNLWYGVAQISHQIYNAIGDVISNTVKLDTALTGLAKVSDLSGEQLKTFATSAGEAGVEIGKTTSEMVDAAAVFAQAGWSDPNELQQLATMAGMFTNIADTQTSTAESAEFLIATMKAFNLTADDTEHIIDAVNEVSNKYAVSSGDLASSIGRVASTLAISGTTFEQTMGLMTGATEIIRNPGKVANGLKTISLRLQGMEEAADGSAQSVDGLSSKMQSEFANIGVSITDANGQIRSTYDILTDVGKEWPKLTANQKAYYAELAAGKNQANIFIALMDNIGTAIEATGTAYDSAGSAAAENAKYMDSIEGKLKQFQAAWEKLSTSLVESDWIKNIVQMGTDLMNYLATPAGIATIRVLSMATAVGVGIKALASMVGTLKELKGGFNFFKSLNVAGQLTETSTSAGKAAGSIGKMGGALSALGPAVAIIGAVAATMYVAKAAADAMTQSSIESNEAITDSAVAAANKAKETQSHYENVKSSLNDVNSRIAEIESRDWISPEAEEELANLKQQAGQYADEVERAEKAFKADNARKQLALNEALNKETHYSQFTGLETFNNKNLTNIEAIDAAIAGASDSLAEFNRLNQSPSQDFFGTTRKQDAESIKKYSDEITRLLPELQDLQATTQQGTKEWQQLDEAIGKGTNFLNNIGPLMQRNTEAADMFGEVAVSSVDGANKTFESYINNLDRQTLAYQQGELSATQYAETITQSMQELASDDSFIEKLNTTDEAFAKMSEEQQLQVVAARELWATYADEFDAVIDAVSSDFSAYSSNAVDEIHAQAEALEGVRDLFVEQNDLHQNAEGLWVDSSGQVNEYANQVQGAIDATNSLSEATQFVSENADLMGQVASGVVNGMSVDAWEASAQGQEAMAQFNSGFQTTLADLQTNNAAAFEQIRSTIQTTMPEAYSSIYNENGTLKTDFNLTAAEGQSAMQILATALGSQVKGAADTGKSGVDSLKESVGQTNATNAAAAASAGTLGGALQTLGGQAQDASGKVKAYSDAWNAAPSGEKKATLVTEYLTIHSEKTEKKASGDDFIKESGYYTVGENGRETVFLPRGSAVATASETRNMRGMLRSGRGSSGGIEVNDDLNDSFKKIANSLVKVTKTLTGVSVSATNQQAPAPVTSSGGASMARAASYDDPHKKNFDAAYDELKYLQDMDRISEQDYLNRLENLNNSYFGGRMEYLEEYRKYEVEVYKGRKKLQEQAQRDAEKAEKDRIQAVKDGFEKEADALEYMRDKDLITEEDYYRQLAALNDKYYKGKTEFLDEYQKYEIKVYEYLKKKEEERLKELKEQTEKQYENTKDYIVDMIDKQIDAEESKLDQLDKEKEQQEKLQKIEEARKKLAEAQQQKVLVYRTGQGFVYESDAAAIEEASKELNELLEEEKFDKQKQEIQDEIDRLEDLKDAWQDSLDINEDLEKYGVLMDWIKAFEEANYEDRLAMAEQFKESYKKALEEIAKAQENISNTASSQLPNFKPNGYARGTNYVRQDEKAVVGENGPELVNLPKGSGVLTAQETQNMRMWGALTPVSLFSDIYKLISSMPRYTFDTPSTAPSFDFSSWTLDVDVDSGLVDAIQNNLRETVIQYISKRDK